MLLLRLFLTLALYGSSTAVAANFTRLDVTGATCTSASKLNNRGQVVGWYCKAEGGIQSVLWQKGKFVPLTSVPGAVNSAAGINDRGAIVGSYVDTEGKAHGYLLENDALISIEFPGAVETAATDISEDGRIIGNYLDDEGSLRGFLLENGRFTSIEIPDADYVQAFGIGDDRRIVGFYVDRELRGRGFVWEQGVVTPTEHPDAALNTALYDLNSRDEIIGFHDGQGGDGFLYRNSRFRTIKFPSSTQDPRVTGINNRRQMVGEYFDESGTFYGFVWRRPAYDRDVTPDPNAASVVSESAPKRSDPARATATPVIQRPWFLEIP